MISGASWLTLGMFSDGLAGGAPPLQTPPLLSMFSAALIDFWMIFELLGATLLTPKTLGGGTPPRGASIRRPTGDGVSNGATRSSFL